MLDFINFKNGGKSGLYIMSVNWVFEKKYGWIDVTVLKDRHNYVALNATDSEISEAIEKSQRYYDHWSKLTKLK